MTNFSTPAATPQPPQWPATTGNPLKKGGSGRSFSRVKILTPANNLATPPAPTPPAHTTSTASTPSTTSTPSATATAILCTYDATREENALYADIADFLARAGFPVPRILAHDAAARRLLLEDLGETDFTALAAAPPAARATAYHAALGALHHLHTHGLARWQALPAATRPRLMPGFDAALYRWEQDYFWEHCVHRLFPHGLPDNLPAAALRAELDALTTRLLRHAPALVHRDCQSENILWRDSAAWFIDFQGLRIGTAFYDLGSLLWDPYVPFTDAERHAFLDHYRHATTTAATVPPLSPADFSQHFKDASAQRLMQALGAYGFLGVVKGKPDFLRHTRPALANLLAVTRDWDNGNPHLPRLAALAALAQKQ